MYSAKVVNFLISSNRTRNEVSLAYDLRPGRQVSPDGHLSAKHKSLQADETNFCVIQV